MRDVLLRLAANSLAPDRIEKCTIECEFVCKFFQTVSARFREDPKLKTRRIGNRSTKFKGWPKLQSSSYPKGNNPLDGISRNKNLKINSLKIK